MRPRGSSESPILRWSVFDTPCMTSENGPYERFGSIQIIPVLYYRSEIIPCALAQQQGSKWKDHTQIRRGFEKLSGKGKANSSYVGNAHESVFEGPSQLSIHSTISNGYSRLTSSGCPRRFAASILHLEAFRPEHWLK